MGRKKIKIARITDDRNRSVTYLKRKAGLMKKAHELAVLTGSEVAVIVFGQNGKLTEFCSGDMDSVLLRYTEHTGPVERKGPENYQNDDDDGSDDGGGGDDDGGDDDDGGAGGGTSGQAWDDGSHNGAGGGGTGYGGPSTSSSAGGSRKGSLAGRNQKRKASNIKREIDAQSTSSGSSSPRRDGSPFTHGGPIIRVESSSTFDGSSEGGVDRGTLKAAIIQRTLSHRSSHSEGQSGFARLTGSPSRPMNVQHHHSFSSGDSFALQQQQFAAHNAIMAAGSSMMPIRPNTAGSMVAPMYGAPRSPFAQETSGLVPIPAQHSGGFLSPQSPAGMAAPVATSSMPPLSRAHNAMATPHAGMTYGDLARGSGGGGSGTTTPTQSVPSGFGVHATQHQSGMPTMGNNSADTTNNGHLMPLAHPILRQHPQFESYSMHLRAQQQHRIPSAPAIHTAPSSPSLLMATEHGTSGPAVSPIGEGLLAPTNGYTPIKRSASFGMATAPGLNGEHGLPQRASFAGQSLPNGGSASDYASLTRPDVNFAPPPPPPYALADLHGTAAAPATPSNVTATSGTAGQTAISNADFNDLMGTILGDMNAADGGDSSFSTVTAVDDQDTKAQPRPIPTVKDTTSAGAAESVMQSLDSEHSFATLVNTDSFDALFAHDGAANTLDDADHKHTGGEARLVTSIAKKSDDQKSSTDALPTIVTAQDAT